MEGGSTSWRPPYWKERLGTSLQLVKARMQFCFTKAFWWWLSILTAAVLLESATPVPVLECVVLAVAGSTAVLVLQQIGEPTPWFWTAPFEVWELLTNRSGWVNHMWMHRTQWLFGDALGVWGEADGFATREGFVFRKGDCSEVQVHLTAQSAWGDLAGNPCGERYLRGCRTVRWLVAGWLLLGGLLLLAVMRWLDPGTWLLTIVLASVAGRALSGNVERMLASSATLANWRTKKTGMSRVSVEPLILPRPFRLEGGPGFMVRREPWLVDTGVEEPENGPRPSVEPFRERTGLRISFPLMPRVQSEEVHMEGVVWRLYRDKQGGLIRGNDGIEMPFRKASLCGVEFRGLFPGQQVCYRVQTGWWGPEAVEIQPMELKCQPFRS